MTDLQDLGSNGIYSLSERQMLGGLYLITSADLVRVALGSASLRPFNPHVRRLP